MADLGLLILSVVMFLGGGYLLSLNIPFWSMFLGIAAIQIGIVFIIFTFEIFTKRGSKEITADYKTIPCLVCGRLDYVPKYKNTTICDSCQLRIARSFRSFVVVIFALFSLTSLVYLVKNNQDIRRQASEKKLLCEEGNWNPSACTCASREKSEFECPEGLIPRTCKDNIEYCCKKEISESSTNWNCQKLD